MKNRYVAILAGACFCLLFPVLSFAEDAADSLQQRLNHLNSMTANFKQVVRADKREVSRSSGSMAIKRPGKFRWDTKNPMAQLVVADGKQLWIYDVELEQVTVKKQEKGIGGTPALFLSGVENTVGRDFLVTMKKLAGREVYYLKARNAQENFQKIEMIFNQQDLSGLVLHDQLGQITKVELTTIKRNLSLAAKLFSFKPPRGVDVIRQ